MGATLRSYFAQGGRKCYVVRLGNSYLSKASRFERLKYLSYFMPGYPNQITSSPSQRYSWQGLGHLFGLPDVSFLCIPDIPDLISSQQTEMSTQIANVDFPEQFVECSEQSISLLEIRADEAEEPISIPVCGDSEYEDWAMFLNQVGQFIARYRREVQLLAAVPIPMGGSKAESNLLKYFSEQKYLATGLDNNPRGLASAFIQLVYPWIRTSGSLNLPGQIENPEGVLAGILSQNALLRGSYRSAANLNLRNTYAVYPLLSNEQMLGKLPNTRHRLLERLSLLGPTPSGLRLLSDVTTSLDSNYRPASVSRLVSLLVRAARKLGENLTFEVAGEQLWAIVQDNLNTLLLRLYQAGALRGKSPNEAFQVRCDRTTMTPNDLDNGRVIAVVQFAAAIPITQITVVLSISEGGQVAFRSQQPVVKEVAA